MKPLHAPFWETIPLAAMSVEQWEALCDLCGKCCLEKLEEEESGRIFYTNVACKLLDPASGRCGNYGQRSRLVHDCIELSPANVANPQWLPTTCARCRPRHPAGQGRGPLASPHRLDRIRPLPAASAPGCREGEFG